MVPNILWQVGEWLTPPVCPACGSDLSIRSGGLCPECEGRLPSWPDRRCPGCGGANDSYLDLCRNCQSVYGGRPWRIAVSGYPYTGLVRRAVHGFKYRNQTYYLEFFASRMAQQWQQLAPGVELDAVTYVPLHWRRYLQRGYNQSQLLAEGLARHLGRPCRRLLARAHGTRPQATLNQEARQRNLRGAFRVLRGDELTGLRLLLVDDVFTTGATLAEAATALLKAGAAEVSVITAARD
jgi:ComF family protein